MTPISVFLCRSVFLKNHTHSHIQATRADHTIKACSKAQLILARITTHSHGPLVVGQLRFSGPVPYTAASTGQFYSATSAGQLLMLIFRDSSHVPFSFWSFFTRNRQPRAYSMRTRFAFFSISGKTTPFR